MTGRLLQAKILSAVIKSSVRSSKTFGSSYDASFDEAHMCAICKDLVFCGLLQGAVEPTYRRYVCLTRIMRRYTEALKLVQEVNVKVTAGKSAAGKGGLGITYLCNGSLRHSEMQDSLLFIEAAAIRTDDSTKDKRTAALLTSFAFCSYAAVLLDE